MLRVTPVYGSHGHNPRSEALALPPSCTLVEYAGRRVLIDVGLDEGGRTGGLEEVPSLPEKVDAVLVCNSSLGSVGGLALRYGASYPGSPPPIYGTFPTRKMGLMTLYDAHARCTADGGDPGYSLDDVDAAFSTTRFSTLKYAQSVVLRDERDGRPALSVTPHRSGRYVGGCYWILRRVDDETEVVVAPDYHHAREKHLDASDLSVRGTSADVLVTRPGGPGGLLSRLYSPLHKKRGGKALLQSPLVARTEGELVEFVVAALRRGGNVLLPVDAAGRALETVLLLDQYWERNRLDAAYRLRWVGPMVWNTLEHCRSQLEWMAGPLGARFDSGRGNPYALRGARTHASVAEMDADAADEGDELPTAVVASGASLDDGPARDLLLRYADDPDNAVVLTDSSRCAPRRDGTDSAARQLLSEWCRAKDRSEEMADAVEIDVLVPHREPLAGRELADFERSEEAARKRRRAREERRALEREVELARGRLRLGEGEETATATTTTTTTTSSGGEDGDGANQRTTSSSGVVTPPRQKKKSRYDHNLFLKFSKPVHLTFECREEAVGVGQSDSTARHGVAESVGRSGEILEDDYGIAVVPSRFVDIVAGIDPSRAGGGRLGDDVLRRGLGFGADGRPVLSGAAAAATRGGATGDAEDAFPTDVRGDGDGDDDVDVEDEAALEAADLSEGRGIVRGRNGKEHVKVSTRHERLEVLAEVAYLPLEGRVDARAARQTVRALQPRRVVLLGGGRLPGEDVHDDGEKRDGGDDAPGYPGETALLAAAVRESAVRGAAAGGVDDDDVVRVPSDGETVELAVGHAAYSARLVDTVYVDRGTREAAAAAGERLPTAPEPRSAEMGGHTVSLLDCVATGQSVAADGSVVLARRAAPRDDDDDDENNVAAADSSVMLSDGDVLLTDLRSEIIALGMKAEYSAHSGYQQLVVNGKIVLRKEQETGKINIEGPLCEAFFSVRSVVCSHYVTL